MAYEIIASGIRERLWRDPRDEEPVVTRKMMHNNIERWKKPTFSTPKYRVVMADPIAGRYAVECTIAANLEEQPIEITRVGEVGPKEMVDSPMEEAYERAFQRAANDLLQIKIQKEGTFQNAKTIPKVTQEVHEVQEVLKDDEVILFGNLKGRTVGELKGTEAFAHFLEQVKNTGNMTFSDPKVTEQYQRLLKTGG